MTITYYSTPGGGVAFREGDAKPAAPAGWSVITQAAYEKAQKAMETADAAARTSARSADCAARKAAYDDLKKHTALSEATCHRLSGWAVGDC